MSLSTSDILALVGIAIAVITLIVTVAIYFHQQSSSEKKNLKFHYQLLWERAARLKRDKGLRQKLLGTTRPFPRFYLREGEARTIAQWLGRGENVAIAGQPLSGKTRLVFEAIRDQPWDLLMPNWVNINPESFVLPKRGGLAFWRRRVVILDDLHRLVEMQGFDHFLRLLTEPGLTVVATCRSNQDEAKIKHYFTAQNLDYEAFFPRHLLLEKIDREVAQDIAQQESKNWEQEVKFNGTVGSIFMKLGEMERRFGECGADLKTILRVLRQLYRCGIYQENQVFPRRWVKLLAQEKGLTGTDYDWSEWFNQLADLEFLTVRPDGEAVEAEEVYLESLVLPELARKRWAEMAEGLAVFAEEADSLYRLGSRAYEVGLNDLDKARYQRLAIQAFEGALLFYGSEQFLIERGNSLNALGNAYQTLGQVEDKAENCKAAIAAYQEALSIFTHNRFPMQYAMTQNNLGNAYQSLGEVEDKAENCKTAIAAYKEALTIFTRDRFPLQYAEVQLNLGSAYATLAAMEDKRDNSQRARQAYEEALKFFTEAKLYETCQIVINNMKRLDFFLSQN